MLAWTTSYQKNHTTHILSAGQNMTTTWVYQEREAQKLKKH